MKTLPSQSKNDDGGESARELENMEVRSFQNDSYCSLISLSQQFKKKFRSRYYFDSASEGILLME